MKQKTKFLLLALFSLLGLGVLRSGVSASVIAGSATISWNAPTTDEGGGPLGGGTNDLAGYRIFYSTTDLSLGSPSPVDAWDNAADQNSRLATALMTSSSISHIDVTEANTIRSASDATKRGYTFSNTTYLTPGQTYYFAVSAYDTSGNYSKVATDSGSGRVGNKKIFRSGNIKVCDTSVVNDCVNGTTGTGVVDISDVGIIAHFYNYGTAQGGAHSSPWCRIDGHPEDINGDCMVDISDVGILAGQWHN